MRISILVIFLTALHFSLLAQTEKSEVPERKVIYYNSFLAGGLLADQGQGTGVTLSMVHGVRLKRFAFGAGIGLDSYLDWKTLPVFGSVSFDFGKVKNNAFFIQCNAGYAEAWRIKSDEWYPSGYHEYGDVMISSVIGYRIMKERFSLYMQAGHKFQEAHSSYHFDPWSSYYPQSSLFVDEEMNRIVVQIGFGLH
jgi:hypothetical protein